LTAYDDSLNTEFANAHLNSECTGKFKHVLVENAFRPVVGTSLPITVKIVSLAHCEECTAAYATGGFEHWLETYRAYKLMDKEESLTDEEKKFLRLHFQVVDANSKASER